MKTITVKAKNRDVDFEINVITKLGPFNSRHYYEFDNEPVSFEVKNDKKCLEVSPKWNPNLIKYVMKNFGISMPKGNVYIELTDASWDIIEQERAEYEQEEKAYSSDLKKRGNMMPVKYYLHNCVDWGDYTDNIERSIDVYREGLPEEKELKHEEVHIISYNLWNKDIEGHEEEWKSDCNTVGINDCISKVEISITLAEKWILIWQQVQDKKEKEAAEKKRVAAEKKAAEEARVKRCFEEAKETGKPVVLHSIFLSGDDIPKRFRDDDSDMGSLVTYAMPDGTAKDRFHHAY
mgnify:CR=1 FL=1